MIQISRTESWIAHQQKTSERHGLVLHCAVSSVVHTPLQGFTLVSFMPSQLPVNDYSHFTDQVIRLHYKPSSL